MTGVQTCALPICFPVTIFGVDRFDVAIEAMDKVSKTNQAKREERVKVVDINKGNNVGDESTQATKE